MAECGTLLLQEVHSAMIWWAFHESGWRHRLIGFARWMCKTPAAGCGRGSWLAAGGHHDEPLGPHGPKTMAKKRVSSTKKKIPARRKSSPSPTAQPAYTIHLIAGSTGDLLYRLSVHGGDSILGN